MPAVYNPRRPRDSPLYRLLEDQFETLLQVHQGTSWAELLQRIFEVDPLRCPRCGGTMKILAFVLAHDVVHAKF